MDCVGEKSPEFACPSEDNDASAVLSQQTDIQVVPLHQSLLRQHQFLHLKEQNNSQQTQQSKQELQKQRKEDERSQMLVNDLAVQRATTAPTPTKTFSSLPPEPCHCGTVFKTESGFRTHHHHNHHHHHHHGVQSRVSSWMCSLCPLKYKRPADLNRHMKRKHGMSLMKNDKNILVPYIKSQSAANSQDMQPLDLSARSTYSDVTEVSMESGGSLESEAAYDEDQPLDLSASKNFPIDYRQKTLTKSEERPSEAKTCTTTTAINKSTLQASNYSIPANQSNIYVCRPSISAPAIRYRPFKCSECGRRSNWRWDLNKHIRTSSHPHAHLIELSEHVARATFHEVLKKDSSLNYDFQLLQESNIKSDSNFQTGESSTKVCKYKQYLCTACGYRSNWKCDMSKHVRSLHPTADVTLLAEDIARETLPNYEHQHGSDNQSLEGPLDEISTNSSNASIPAEVTSNEYIMVKCGPSDITLSFSSSHTVDARKTKKFKCSSCPYRSNFRSDVGRHIRHKHDRATCKIVVMSEAEAASTLGEYMDTWARKKFVPSPNKRRCLMSLNCSHIGTTLTQHCEPSFTVTSTTSSKVEQSDKVNSSTTDFSSEGPIKTLKAKRWWKCSSCDFRDQSKDIIVQHWHYQHNNSLFANSPEISNEESSFNKKYHREVCSEDFSDKSDEINFCDSPVDFKQERDRTSTDSAPSSVDSFKQEKKEHITEIKKHACDICPYRTNSSELLNIHKSYHIPKEGNTNTCPICPYFVCALPLLNQHLALHNDDLKRPQLSHQKSSETSCAVDPQSSPTTKIGDSSPTVNFSSSLCCEQQEKTHDKVSVFLMTNAVRTGGRTTYLCSQCPYVSCNRNDYLYHRQFHRPRPTAFKCPHCPYWVSQKRLLSQHFKVHELDYQQKHRGQGFIDATKRKAVALLEDDNNNNNVDHCSVKMAKYEANNSGVDNKTPEVLQSYKVNDDQANPSSEQNNTQVIPTKVFIDDESKNVFFESLGLTTALSM